MLISQWLNENQITLNILLKIKTKQQIIYLPSTKCFTCCCFIYLEKNNLEMLSEKCQGYHPCLKVFRTQLDVMCNDMVAQAQTMMWQLRAGPPICPGYLHLPCGLILSGEGTTRVSLRADSRLAPSQWEMSLQSNAVSYWQGANLKSALSLVYL